MERRRHDAVRAAPTCTATFMERPVRAASAKRADREGEAPVEPPNGAAGYSASVPPMPPLSPSHPSRADQYRDSYGAALRRPGDARSLPGDSFPGNGPFPEISNLKPPSAPFQFLHPLSRVREPSGSVRPRLTH